MTAHHIGVALNEDNTLRRHGSFSFGQNLEY
jgi:hypothetical protein